MKVVSEREPLESEVLALPLEPEEVEEALVPRLALALGGCALASSRD